VSPPPFVVEPVWAGSFEPERLLILGDEAQPLSEIRPAIAIKGMGGRRIRIDTISVFTHAVKFFRTTGWSGQMDRKLKTS
jgi:hypothetical protein